MPLKPVLIAGHWRSPGNIHSFSAVNPATKESLSEHYPISDRAMVETALEAGQKAAQELKNVPPENIARFLERCADNLESRTEALVETAHLETGYPKEARLRSVELPRTMNQLRQAAQAARERSFRLATIDTKNNIRSMHAPLGGPVLVLGPNNFPFAFNGVMGGDFAAAIAAGNPVISKAHPSHPGTSKLLAEAAFHAIKASELPAATVQLVYKLDRQLGLELAAHPALGAVGFTGSRSAGLALKAACDKVGKPVYLEMSSINPVFILPAALDQRPRDIATELFNSCTLGAGQFCTNPGISVVVEGAAAEGFLMQVQAFFEGKPGGTLLGSTGPGNIAESIQTLVQHGAKVVTGGKEQNATDYSFENTVLRVSGQQFLKAPGALQTEAFGPVHLMVLAKDPDEMTKIAGSLDGNLTGSIYSHTEGADDALYGRVAEVLRTKVGRLINDKMPTGVAVSPAMNHGGPFPATGHPGFTAVGIPASLRRFTALHSYDAVRHERLPPELRNENPTGKMWRIIDGQWSQKSV